jgi:uncharacterized protein (DUF305 family)
VIRPRTAFAVAAAISLAAALAACGDDSGSSGSTSPPPPSASSSAGMSGEFNDQDATFAGIMIAHHQQAIVMADMAAGRSSDPKVLALARRIEAAQAPEIQTMTGWLTAWGKPMPEGMSGMDMGDPMPGMMSAAQMDKLKGMKGTDFDRRFLTMMIAHHVGAITMAKTELATGQSPEAKALALCCGG